MSPARKSLAKKSPDDSGQPRYLQIARELKAGITGGTYPVGARLPTELELCELFAISRFTARAAVRELSSAGLVTRRQRVGTVVVATPDQSRYAHGMSSLRDLWQYAQETELRIVYVGKIALGKAQAREMGAKPGDEWIYVVGIRIDGSGEAPRPIGITRLFLSPVLRGIEARLREPRSGAVYDLIQREYGLNIERVEQELQGVVLEADDAANLGAEAGAPALRILRRYYGEDGRLLEMADNVHPSDRFTYRMQLSK